MISASLPTTTDYPVDTSSDGHVHTKLCNHARGEMEEYVRAAVRRNLKTIIFTEHLEAGVSYYKRLWLRDEDFEIYFREGRRLKKKYAKSIEVRLGVEVGFNPDRVPELRKRISRFTWDKIGLSYHFFPIGDSHYNIVSKRSSNLKPLARLGVDRVLTGYFDCLLQAIDEIDADVLCHLDAAMRYYPGLQLKDSHWYQIEGILDRVGEKNLGLEINTSGYAIRGEPFPAGPIIREAVRRNITLAPGSDAHAPEDVGRYFSEIPACLKIEKEKNGL